MDAPTPYRLTDDDQDGIVRKAAHAAGHLPASQRDAAVALALDLYEAAARHGHEPASINSVTSIPTAAAELAQRLVTVS
ncbi:hypothetical protein AB0I28_28820 [Phytomonospora sp. NPDC050363]|uniref:hypothetical protein n=1 Tax=Phytomonospora sp. NPDC050363 TaxID=3155642 RepID=UPI0033FA3A0C